jgi:hypothetical protein
MPRVERSQEVNGMLVRTGMSLGAVLTVLTAGCAAPVPAAGSNAPPAAPPAAEATATTSTASETRPAGTTSRTKQSDSVEAQRAELLKARASFQAFLARADGKPDYAAAVGSAKERIEDIDRMLIFLGEETARQ